jgi:hypothetical protein
MIFCNKLQEFVVRGPSARKEERQPTVMASRRAKELRKYEDRLSDIPDTLGNDTNAGNALVFTIQIISFVSRISVLYIKKSLTTQPEVLEDIRRR